MNRPATLIHRLTTITERLALDRLLSEFESNPQQVLDDLRKLRS